MLLRETRIGLFAVGLLWSCMLFAGTQPEIPAWVQQAASQSQGSYPSETKAEVLLDENTFSVTSPSEYVETYRRVVRILRPEGREEGEVNIPVSKDDRLLSLRAWSIDKSGNKYEMKQKEFGERMPFSYELFSDLRYFTGQLPASAPGSVVAFEYQVKRRSWRTSDHWMIQESLPVRQAVFNLELPPGWEFATNWANRESVAPESVAAGKWRWSVRDVPAIADDEYRPAQITLAQYMAFSCFPAGSKPDTWSEIGAWSRQLAADRRIPSPEITDKVRQITAGTNDFDRKVRSLATFLQREVRYVAIEIGIGGYQPHAAADVFRSRYGDCKDKASLLSAMLKEAGINSELALVNTVHGATRLNVPENSFNHMILGIELPDGVPAENYVSAVKTSAGKRFLIFDPTDEYTQVGFVRSELQGNYMLLQSPSGGELLQIPKSKPDLNLLERTAKMKLGADGVLTGEITERRTGDHANDFRSRLHEATEKERTQVLERIAARSLKQYNISDIRFEDLNAPEKDLVVQYKLNAPSYAQSSGPLLLVRNRVTGPVGRRLPNKPRTYGVELGDISHIRDVVEIELPSGQAVDDLPFPAKLDVEFASYESHFEAKGNMVRYTRDYIVRDPHLPLEKVPTLKKLEKLIAEDEFASTVFKKVQ